MCDVLHEFFGQTWPHQAGKEGASDGKRKLHHGPVAFSAAAVPSWMVTCGMKQGCATSLVLGMDVCQ